MISRILIILAIAIMIVSCSYGLQDPVARKTIGGASQRQILAVAQQAVTDKGYDIESVEYGDGILATIWKEEPRRSIRYEVTALTPDTSDPDFAGPVTIQVVAKTKDRIVGGWSQEYTARLDSDDLLDVIVHLVTEQIAKNSSTFKEMGPDSSESDDEEEPETTPPAVVTPPTPTPTTTPDSGITEERSLYEEVSP